MEENKQESETQYFSLLEDVSETADAEALEVNLRRKNRKKYIAGGALALSYIGCAVYAVMVFGLLMRSGLYGEWEYAVGLLSMLIVSKVLSFKKSKIIRVVDALNTILLCLSVISYKRPANILLLIGIVFCVLTIHYWQTFYEILITFTVVFYVTECMQLPVLLELPFVVGMLLIGILLFNNVKRWHGKNILLFNILALFGQAYCFLGILHPVYQNAYTTFLCMFVFGLATIVLTFQKKYHMDFRGKYVILIFFLIYMTFVFTIRLTDLGIYVMPLLEDLH